MPPSTVPGRMEKKNKTKKEIATRKVDGTCRWSAAIELMWFVCSGLQEFFFKGVSWYISVASSAFWFTPGLPVVVMMAWLVSFCLIFSEAAPTP